MIIEIIIIIVLSVVSVISFVVSSLLCHKNDPVYNERHKSNFVFCYYIITIASVIGVLSTSIYLYKNPR